MPIKLKVARSAKELDDVFKLRYDVFVAEKNKFKLSPAAHKHHTRIVDHFDAIPGSYNIIVYDDNDEPIATMRINKDSEIGLPSEMHFDFSDTRKKIAEECEAEQINSIIASAGMLAIQKQWRNRRDIINIMSKTAINIMHSFNTSHIITTVSIDSQSLFYRLGFKVEGLPQWSESIGDHLIPMLAPFNKVFHWGFGKTHSLDTLSNKQKIFDQKSYSDMQESVKNIERRAISREYLQNVA